MSRRGSYKFEIDDGGRIVHSVENAELLRRLLLDWDIIGGYGGPGANRGDGGSWHGFCHLAAAAGSFRTPEKCGAWVGIVFDPDVRQYRACACFDHESRVHTYPLQSPDTKELLRNCTWCGYIEGASRGHILDRNAHDPGDPGIHDRRQDYDHEVDSMNDGGPVWEFWTASRNIADPCSLGHGLVNEYLALLSVLGGRFASVVARGRAESEYGHLKQLGAMVNAGLITRDEALWDILPAPIPRDIELTLHEALPTNFAMAASVLVKTTREAVYYMYARKLASFASAVRCAHEIG